MNDTDHAHILRRHAWNVIPLTEDERYDIQNAADHIDAQDARIAELEAQIERLEIIVEQAEQGGFRP